MPRIGQLGLVLWITVTFVSLDSIAGADTGEKAARMTSAPAKPTTASVFVIFSSLIVSAVEVCRRSFDGDHISQAVPNVG